MGDYTDGLLHELYKVDGTAATCIEPGHHRPLGLLFLQQRLQRRERRTRDREADIQTQIVSRTFVDGFCTVCGAPDPDYTGEPDGLPMAPEQEQLPASAAPTEGPVP